MSVDTGQAPEVLVQGRFAAVLLRPGDRYGRDKCLEIAAGARPLVEFWDLRYAHDPIAWAGPYAGLCGQFTGGRYYADTIAAHPSGVPLALDTSQTAWTVPAGDMDEFVRWLAACGVS